MIEFYSLITKTAIGKNMPAGTDGKLGLVLVSGGYHFNRTVPNIFPNLYPAFSRPTSCRLNILDIQERVSYNSFRRKQVLIKLIAMESLSIN